MEAPAAILHRASLVLFFDSSAGRAEQESWGVGMNRSSSCVCARQIWSRVACFDMISTDSIGANLSTIGQEGAWSCLPTPHLFLFVRSPCRSWWVDAYSIPPAQGTRLRCKVPQRRMASAVRQWTRSCCWLWGDWLDSLHRAILIVGGEGSSYCSTTILCLRFLRLMIRL